MLVATAQKIRQALGKARHIVVTTHVSPDGDALGSLTAVGAALASQGKQAILVCDDEIPARFSFLPLFDRIQRTLDQDVSYDLVLVLDCGDETRIGQVGQDLPEPRPTFINIDHHVTNTRFGDIDLVDPDATSTAEILYHLFAELDYALTADVALCLLTGVVTDTLGFRTDGVTAKTLSVASDLMEAGADLSLVTMQTLNLMPLSTLRLWRVGLDNMKLEEGLLWTVISHKERSAVGYAGDSSSGLSNLLVNVESVAISAVLLEMADDTVRVGFRARPPYNVSELAQRLGGGGHPLAAGCKLEGPLAKAEAMVVELGKKEIRKQSA